MEHAIEASAHLREPLDRVRAALALDLGLLVSPGTTTGPKGGDRFESSLAIEIGSGTQVQQAIVGEVGPMVQTGDALVVAVQWDPASHAHLLPSFSGRFELTADPPGSRIVLRGAYTVPLGPAGLVADWAAGRRLAQRVLTRHLESAADRIDQEARLAAPSEEQPSPGSENFLG